MPPNGRRLRVGALIVVAVFSAAVWAGLHAADVFRVLELNTVDARFPLRGERPHQDLVVVAIDDVTFGELQRQFPFPRSMHGRVIERLRNARARAIAYDVQFTEPTVPREDNALIEAIARAGNVVLSTTEVDERGRTNVLGGEETLRQVGARAGHTTINQDPGGVQRRFPFSISGLESFAVATVEVARGRQVDRALFGGRDAWIDFVGGPREIKTVSFSRVLRGRVPSRTFRDKIVVVGASAPSLQDVHPVPTGGDELMAGPEIQANVISTVLRGLPLEAVPRGIATGLIVLMALVAPLAGLVGRSARWLLVAAPVGVLYVGVSLLAFRGGLIFPLVHPIGALVTGAVGALVVALVLGALERQRVRDAFARFVPEQVVDEALAATNDDLRLGGVRRRSTVLFSDLRGFTSFAESLDPDVVIAILNRYLESMSDAILDNGGTLVAYMGDGIMAVFGAPLEQPDHGDRAVAAAREMAGERLERFNAWLAEEGFRRGFDMGIGLNTGWVMSGNVGSKRRLEYTAIGDTTNTAARLEGMTKGTPHQVFVSDSTRCCLEGVPDDLIEVGELEVRGRAQAVKVWALSSVDKAASRAPVERV